MSNFFKKLFFTDEKTESAPEIELPLNKAQTEQAREIEFPWRIILESVETASNTGSWILEHPESPFRFSPLLCKLIRVEPDTQIFFSDFVSLIHADDQKQFEVLFSEGWKGKNAHSQFRMRRANGAPAIMEISLKMMSNPSGNILTGILKDITVQKEAEEKKIRQNQILMELARSPFVHSGNKDETFKQIVEKTTEALQIEQCGIWLFNDSRTKLECIWMFTKGIGFSIGTEIVVSEHPAYFEYLKKHHILPADQARTHEATADFLQSYLIPHHIFSMLDAGIIDNGEIIGTICCETINKSVQWSSDDIFFCTSITDIIKSVLQSAIPVVPAAISPIPEPEPTVVLTAPTQVNSEEYERAVHDLKVAQNQLIQSERMATLGVLVAGVAHEINTPLGAIISAGQFLEKTIGPTIRNLPTVLSQLTQEEQDLFFKMVDRSLNFKGTLTAREERQYKKVVTEFLESNGIEKSGLLASLMVKIGLHEENQEYLPIFRHPYAVDVVDLAGNIGKLRFNIDNINLAASKTHKIVFALKNYSHRSHSDQPILASLVENVETVLTIYHNKIKYEIELTKEIEEAMPSIYCFPDELSQIWTNLIHNALQAMEGKGKMYISIKREGDFQVVRIVDSGCGIPEENIAKIFNPFFTTKKQGEGTGLGLDIVRKIVEKHHGTISVQSNPGRTEFIVSLPGWDWVNNVRN